MVANLVGSMGIPNATKDTLKSLRHFFPRPNEVSPDDLLDYYGLAALQNLDVVPVIVALDTLRFVLAVSLHLSSPHRDGWRVEYLTSIASDHACGEALASLMTTLIKGDVSDKIADLLSSAILVILLKKYAETMAQMKLLQGDAYLQPHRPLGMGSTLVKVASNCPLHLLNSCLGPAVGSTQFYLETKGGCDHIHLALRMAMESNGRLSAACLDVTNAFGEIERECIKDALLANPSLHMLIPLFEMIYERGSGELWYYDEKGNFMEPHFSRSGVRQGCVLGAFLFCLAMYTVYARLQALLGLDDALYAYSDDVYLLSDSIGMAKALAAAPTIDKKVGLRPP